jgi:hypothetical protein
VHHCDSKDKESIARFLNENWGLRYKPDPGFGAGNAASRFIELIDSPVFWFQPLQKYFNEEGDYG